MWRPDRSIRGPFRPSLRDIDALNRVFADAFTDRYARDGLVGVRVPHLNPVIWRYALEDAGDGAMVWRDAEGHMLGFNMVHRSGSEGWMGPLAVRPDRQSEGIGSAMVRAGIDWLLSEGARTVGLETMPRTVDNIGFYSRLGLVPGPLTITLVQEVGRRTVGDGDRLSRAGLSQAMRIEECRVLTDRLLPGVDFTREILLTAELAVGDTNLLYEGDRLVAYALWHATPLAAGRPKDELRVLKVVAEDLKAFDRVLEGVQAAAAAERVRRTAIRCQADFPEVYLRLIAAGYRVHWTDLRMFLHDRPQRIPNQGVVMSNWEI